MGRLPLILLTVLLVVINGLADELSGMPGAFATRDLGPRGAALAGAQTANPHATEALLYNPADLFDVKWSGGYAYSRAFDLIPYNFPAASYRFSKTPLAFGVVAIQNGDAIYSENELFFGVSTAWGFLRFGTSWKLRYASTGSGGEDFLDPESGQNTKVSGTGMGLAGFDFGVKGVFWKEKLCIGAVMKDAFSAVAWDTENEAGTAEGKYTEYVPLSIKVGMAYRFLSGAVISVDIEPGLYHLPPPFDFEFFKTYEDIKNRLCLGLELYPLGMFSSGWVKELIALRGGYSEDVFEKDKAKVFAMGGGLAFPMGSYLNVAIDAGYQINTIFQGNNSPIIGLSIWSP
ncbi:MAG: hypothetical protein HQK83_02300 [Fibrobacteria bacterium]|nr:hypothetical protein [Fibrobacteria bacterium]